MSELSYVPVFLTISIVIVYITTLVATFRLFDIFHWHTSLFILKMYENNMEGEKRQYSMHTSLFLYVGNFILFCKLCHYIM